MTASKNKQPDDEATDAEPVEDRPDPPEAEAEEDGDAALAAPEDPIAALELEVADLNDQLLRALAETENTRRRAEREHQDIIRYGVTNLVRDILAVADNLQRALDSVPADARTGNEAVASLATGVEMTGKEFLSALERHGVQKVEPLGERFDHNLHQAMFALEGTGQPAGTIVELMQPGYMLHDRLLRPAMVGVAKGDPDTPPGDVEHIDTTA